MPLANEFTPPEPTDILFANRPVGNVQTRQIQFPISDLPGGGGAGATGATGPAGAIGGSGATGATGPAAPTAVTPISSAGSVTLNFTLPNQQINPLSNDVTFSSSNLAPGRAINLRLVADGSTRNLAFPGSWVFVGAAAPAALAAGKTARLTAESWSTTDASVVVAYAVEP